MVHGFWGFGLKTLGFVVAKPKAVNPRSIPRNMHSLLHATEGLGPGSGLELCRGPARNLLRPQLEVDMGVSEN